MNCELCGVEHEGPCYAELRNKMSMTEDQIRDVLRTRDNPHYETSPDYLHDWNVQHRILSGLGLSEWDRLAWAVRDEIQCDIMTVQRLLKMDSITFAKCIAKAIA